MTNGVTYNLIYKGNECSEKQSAEGLKSTWVAQCHRPLQWRPLSNTD